jgi:hypothetical protein
VWEIALWEKERSSSMVAEKKAQKKVAETVVEILAPMKVAEMD